LDTARVLAEIVEKAGVAPIPVYDAADLREHAVFLVDQDVLETEIGMDEPEWRMERRIEGVLLEACRDLFFDGRVKRSSTLRAVGIVFSMYKLR
jgi:hypothetical protein